MPYNANDAYLESQALSADGLELVRLLYQAAIGAVRDARRHLAARDIFPRSRAIIKTHRILTELIVSLDHERGGEFSRRLARLYDYMCRRLLEANMKQIDQPLEEVLGLLEILMEGWNALQNTVTAEPASESPWADVMPQAQAPDPSNYGSHAWSF